jgi:long-chain acyl-CoA synthetase
MNLYANLANAMKGFLEKDAYVFYGNSETYRELDEKVNQFAFGLTQQGIGKGDTVALMLGNSPEFIIAYYGTLCAGATVVPVNPAFSAREINYILSDSKAKGIVAEVELQAVLNEMKHTLPFLEFTVYTRPLDHELEFGSFLHNNVHEFKGPPIKEENVAVILYTSGTTGDPKGVMLTHKNLHSNAEACLALFDLTSEDRIVTVLPVFHIFCMTVCMNASILSGATMLLLPKFSPKDVIGTIYCSQATVFAGVPTMYNFLLQGSADPEKFLSLRICISGGASLPLAVINSFKEHTVFKSKRVMV